MFTAGIKNAVVVKLLRAEYERRSKLMPLSWFNTIQLPLENVYTRLKIVPRRKADFQVENDEVDVYDIFTALDKGNDVMTLVEGIPGIGKTTFCLKLAFDWARETVPANSSFPKFEFVLLLKCRDIDKDIMETIKEQLLPEDIKEETWTTFSEFIKDVHNQEKILIILDGLDELPQNSQYFVKKLLHRRILPFCYILVTSRQEKGFEVRNNFKFDLLLEIKGFTEDDAFGYIKKHFQNVGLENTSKGEKLIEEFKKKSFLNALRNNPLNLLLLCVVYEDYEGELPTSRTELYNVIVRCLLKRYCSKQDEDVPEDDNTLMERFEEDILALGELAWTCLLKDRQSFCEEELAEREVRNKNLVARKIGLLYKEERLKRILGSQHEYWFLHKTFQEYLAAAFITHKLLRGELNVFEYTTFDDLVEKYPQVFLFVSGMLGEKATVLFTQIGETLYEEYWDWNECSQQASTFFVESFSESGRAEQMATTLCNIIPFPDEVFLKDADDIDINIKTDFSFAKVLIACKSFSVLRTPVELYAVDGLEEDEVEFVIDCMESLLQLKTVSLVFSVTSRILSIPFPKDRFCKWLSSSKSLSEFTLKLESVCYPDLFLLLGDALNSCPTLTKVTFAVPGEKADDVFNAVETRLSADTLPPSFVLEIYSSMSYTAIQALQKLLSNKSLMSLSLRVFGDVQDLLAAAVGQALARQRVLNSLELCFCGKLRSSGASFLRRGVLENSSLNYLTVRVYGELPGNWQSFVENLRVAKKSSVTCFFYPSSWNNVADNPFRHVVVNKGRHLKQQLTVNVWGGMSCKAAEALCKALARSSISFFTLNVHGNLTSEVANSIARCLEGCRTLYFLSINIWGELTTEGGITLSRLSTSNLSFHLNVHDALVGPDESNNLLDFSIDNTVAMIEFFAKVKDTRNGEVSLIINNDRDVIKGWTRYLGDALSENNSLTSLNVAIHNCLMDEDFGDSLGESLLQSTSLKSLSLTINVSDMKDGWKCKLGDCLAKIRSLTTLSLNVNFYGEGKKGVLSDQTKLINMLVPVDSLSALSVAVHSGNVASFWNAFVGDCLIECTSLKKLSLTFNVDGEFLDDFDGISVGLAMTTSLNTLSLTIFVNSIDCETSSGLFESLNSGFELNVSVNTLNVTVTVNTLLLLDFPSIFREGLSVNTSVTTLSLTIHEYREGISDISDILNRCGVFQYLAKNTSVTTFNLTLNSSKDVDSDYWLSGLCNALKKNSSLTTLRLKVTHHCATLNSHLYDFSKLLIESQTLASLELDLSFYGKDSGCQNISIQ